MNSPEPSAAHASEVVAQALWERLRARPYDFDLFQALRRIEGAHPHLPRLGQALRPQDEPVRFAQEPSLSFAPSAIGQLEQSASGRTRLVQRVMGFLGPNGALPIHLTEYVRERSLHNADPTLARFLDMLLHRFGLLFYRAWTRAQPTVMLDRPEDASIERWLGAFFGLGLPTMRQRDGLADHAKLYYAGRLARQVRDADGLRAWIQVQFDVHVDVRQFVGHWMPLHAEERSRLARHGQRGLGQGAVLGGQVWDVQHKFRLVIGPLTWAQYQDFLPGAQGLKALRSLVRQYLGFEFAWDLQLIVRKDEVPPWAMGQSRSVGALGRSSWFNQKQRSRDAQDLIMNVEHLTFQ
jgi:type VI secretion system protein ImpH